MSPEKKKHIKEFIDSLDKLEQAWANGYLEAVLNETSSHEPAGPGTAVPNKKITIAYGTESGNSKKIANIFASRVKKEGIQAKLVSLDQYRLTDLPKEEYFLTVISTQGEGEPPASAKKFYDHIHQNGFQ
ncbi:MAG: flavodoxin domain-containing protein, partial [Bacteroidota bacterium]|nr:flavodoxin domain-containing protein [Bacteroidota bacterium]